MKVVETFSVKNENVKVSLDDDGRLRVDTWSLSKLGDDNCTLDIEVDMLIEALEAAKVKIADRMH